jgi:hypothetical protein
LLFRCRAEYTQVWRMGNKRAEATQAPTDSEWFDRFITGAENRLGNRLKQDLAISIEVMLELMARYEAEYQQLRLQGKPLRKTTEHAAYCVISFCASLRGWEPLKILLSYLIEFSKNARSGETKEGVTPHVALPLAGKFEMRGNMDQNIRRNVAEETKSGLKPKVWVDRLIETWKGKGIVSGWAFRASDGSQARMSDFEEGIFNKA